jgi:ectoine hydroxylase-related dioxygenase (phytanoyl-CoA dioxygenase family)
MLVFEIKVLWPSQWFFSRIPRSTARNSSPGVIEHPMTAVLPATEPDHATAPAQPAFAYLQKTTAITDVDGIVKGLKDDGFALIPGVINAAEIQELREAIDRLSHFGVDDKSEYNDHFKCVFNRDRAFRPYLDKPGIIDAAERMMGEQCHIIGMTAWRSRPGRNGWGVHIDQLMMTLPEATFADPAFELPMWIGTAHFYLDDITSELSPTYMIPGSHKSGRGPAPQEESWNGRKPEPVLCKAGDVLFFRSEVWHSGSKNETASSSRYLLQVHYSHRFIAQKFTPWPFQYNPELLALATPRQLRIIGKHPVSNYG